MSDDKDVKWEKVRPNKIDQYGSPNANDLSVSQSYGIEPDTDENGNEIPAHVAAMKDSGFPV